MLQNIPIETLGFIASSYSLRFKKSIRKADSIHKLYKSNNVMISFFSLGKCFLVESSINQRFSCIHTLFQIRIFDGLFFQ